MCDKGFNILCLAQILNVKGEPRKGRKQAGWPRWHGWVPQAQDVSHSARNRSEAFGLKRSLAECEASGRFATQPNRLGHPAVRESAVAGQRHSSDSRDSRFPVFNRESRECCE